MELWQLKSGIFVWNGDDTSKVVGKNRFTRYDGSEEIYDLPSFFDVRFILRENLYKCRKYVTDETIHSVHTYYAWNTLFTDRYQKSARYQKFPVKRGAARMEKALYREAIGSCDFLFACSPGGCMLLVE